MYSLDCPINSDSFPPGGSETDTSKDPNAALWLSIRPGPPPSWAARLRERAAALSVAALGKCPRKSFSSWIVSRISDRDWRASAIAGLVVGVASAFAVRPLIVDVAESWRVERSAIAQLSPRVESTEPTVASSRALGASIAAMP